MAHDYGRAAEYQAQQWAQAGEFGERPIAPLLQALLAVLAAEGHDVRELHRELTSLIARTPWSDVALVRATVEADNARAALNERTANGATTH